MSQTLCPAPRLGTVPPAPTLLPTPTGRLPRWLPHDPGLAIVLLLPIVLLLIDPTWIFGNHPCDAWYYFGFYADFAGHLKHFQPSYYGSRLSAILVGALVYGWLPPLWANCVLHLGLHWASAVSVYATLARTVGRRAALLGAVFMGCYVHFLQAIGWDYVDSFGIAYAALTALALVRASDSPRWRVWLLAAGAGFAALVIAQLIWGLVLPGLLVLYAGAQRQQRRFSLIAGLVCLTAGGLGLVLALSCFSWWYAGQFWFLWPSLQFMFRFASGPDSSIYKVPVSTWLPTANHLVLPIITLVGAVGTLIGTRGRLSRGGSPMVRWFQAQFLVNMALFALSEKLPAMCFLTHSLYASMLIPSMFLALGSLLYTLVRSLSRNQFALVAALTIGMVFLSITWPGFLGPILRHSRRVAALYFLPGLAAIIVWARWRWLGRPKQERPGWTIAVAALLCLLPLLAERVFVRLSGQQPPIIWALVPGMAALGLLVWPRPSIARAALFVLLIVVSQLRAYPSRPIGSPSGSESYHVVIQGMQAVHEVDPTSSVFFWFDAEEANADSYVSLACNYNWGYRLINTRFPALTSEDVAATSRVTTRFSRTFTSGMKVALLSETDDALERANHALHRLGYEGRPLRSSVIEQGKVRFTMTFVEIVPWAAAD